MKLTALAVAGCAALGLGVSPAHAAAAEAPSAVLDCGSNGSYEVTGFGRGESLRVVGTTSNFVVTFARLEPSGVVVMDIPGQQGRADVLTCTTTTPSGTAFTFRGFFTPRG